MIHAALDLGGLAVAFNDGAILFVHDDALRTAEVFETDAFELHAEVFADELAAREDGNVFAHRFAAITEAGCFDGAHVDRAAQLVHNESREGFAFHVFRNDEERLADLRDLFEEREQILEVADLLLEVQNVSVFELGFHRLRVGHEIRREITLVELHTFNHVERRLDGLRFFDCDGAVFADLVHRVSNDVADGLVPVGGHGCDLLDLFLVLDLLGDLVEVSNGGFNSLVDAALNADGVRACGDELQAFAINRFCENRRRRGAVTGVVAGLARDFANHLGTHVFVRIFEFDFFRHRHTVFGDRRRTEFFVEDDVATFWSECGDDRAREFAHATEDCLPCCFVEQ